MGPLDKLYWMRTCLGVLLGLISAFVELGTGNSNIFLSTNFGIVLIVYIITFYIGKPLVGTKIPKEQATKIFTAGVGTYFLLWLFVWVMITTLRAVNPI